MSFLVRIALITLCMGSMVNAFYIPGTGPIAYSEGDVVNVNVNGLHSIRNVIPYDYYSGPFCRPNVISSRHETIGELLSGENQLPSPYYLNMLYDSNCRPLQCTSALDDDAAKQLENLIEKEYRAYMVVDNLPAFKNATAVFQGRCSKPYKQIPYQRGYALGVPKACTGAETLINNHLHFRVQYHRVEKNTVFTVGDVESQDGEIAGQKKQRIKKKATDESDDNFLVVGITIEPFSVKWPTIQANGDVPACTSNFDPTSANVEPLTTKYRGPIAWTFGVTWVEEPNIRWASRWDSYLHTSVADSNNRVHWLLIANALLIVASLVSAIFVTMVRVLRKQIAQYNITFDLSKEETRESQRDESGWKMISGDVFRPPRQHQLLVILVAAGTQVAVMVSSTLTLSLFGFLSPAMRGGFMTALLSTFVLSSLCTGYVAARMHIKLGGERSWPLIFKASSFIPSILFTVFIFCNLLLKSVKSSGSVPFVALVALMALWLLVAIPLALIGARFGFRVLPGNNPKKTTSIPRPIDPALEAPLLKTEVVLLITGALPLATLFLELRFILASVWQGVVYYVFGFLFIVFVLWSITVALTSIVVVYYKLCSENYHWWWIAFLAPSSGGLHLAIFFVYSFATSLSITSKIATMIYFLYMGLATLLYILAAGAIGFFAAWKFNFLIYSSIKTE